MRANAPLKSKGRMRAIMAVETHYMIATQISLQPRNAKAKGLVKTVIKMRARGI